MRRLSDELTCTVQETPHGRRLASQHAGPRRSPVPMSAYRRLSRLRCGQAMTRTGREDQFRPAKAERPAWCSWCISTRSERNWCYLNRWFIYTKGTYLPVDTPRILQQLLLCRPYRCDECRCKLYQAVLRQLRVDAQDGRISQLTGNPKLAMNFIFTKSTKR